MKIRLFNPQAYLDAAMLGAMVWLACKLLPPLQALLVAGAMMLAQPHLPACSPPTVNYASHSEVFSGTVIRPGMQMPASGGD